MEYLPLFVPVLLTLAGAWLLFRRKGRRRPKPRSLVLPAQFIIVDIDTTVLDPLKHEIIEIAAIRVNRDPTLHDTFTGLVKPKRKISAKIASITGITNDLLEQEGEPLEEVVAAFLDFIGDRPLVFYNASFDMSFLIRAAGRVSREINNPVTCALAAARQAWPGLPSYNLGNLCRMANCQTNGAHRALRDCELTMQVYAAAASVLGPAA